MARTLLDVLMAGASKKMTREEFADAMRSGDEERKEKAIDAMHEAGGYDNLEVR